MNSELTSHLEVVLGSQVLRSASVSGGDIANAFVVETVSDRFFVKTSTESWAEDLFKSESRGLKQLEATQTVKVPKVYAEGLMNQTGYLVLEFIESKSPNAKDFERLGHKLAELHLIPQTNQFGASFDNYIGHLPQNNSLESNWVTFYIEQRLLSQINLAKQRGFLTRDTIPSKAKMERVCHSIIGKVDPSLLHGDLWGGNFLIALDGTPVLVDPSTYVGHSEVDLAMSRLFGGFSPSFYAAYHELIKRHPRQKDLTEMYQLYYLLVHLNLFGNSYRNSVLAIINKYFR
ncbi:MAG: fructosamine kinase family protein [Bacteroidota bacterium]